jgi:hypothetical protein
MENIVSTKQRLCFNLCVCWASSLVGDTNTALTPPPFGTLSWCITGNRKAAVLPEPVGAHANNWCPCIVQVIKWELKKNLNHNYMGHYVLLNTLFISTLQSKTFCIIYNTLCLHSDKYTAVFTAVTHPSNNLTQHYLTLMI